MPQYLAKISIFTLVIVYAYKNIQVAMSLGGLGNAGVPTSRTSLGYIFHQKRKRKAVFFLIKMQEIGSVFEQRVYCLTTILGNFQR